MPALAWTRRSFLAGLSAGVSAGLSAAGGTALAQTAGVMPVRHAIDLRPGAPAVFQYEFAVLKLLLERSVASHGPYELIAQEPVPQARSFRLLASGELDVAQALSSPEHEALAEPLRHCLHRGLLGLRQAFVRQGRVEDLERVGSLAELRRLRIAQVVGWPDIEILQANGVPVQRLPRLELVPEALRRDRADLSALGVTEAGAIVGAWRDLSLLQHWLIAYPAVYYIYVSRRRPELHARLQAAWQQVLADGSFVALFERLLGATVHAARLGDKRWIQLSNPVVPASLLDDGSPLWHPALKGRWSGG